METDVAQYIPAITKSDLAESNNEETEKEEEKEAKAVSINLNELSMSELRKTLSKHPIKTRLSLKGTIVVARDIAHAKMLEKSNTRRGCRNTPMGTSSITQDRPKRPRGTRPGVLVRQRLVAYVRKFIEHGGSYVTLAKGNRSKAVTNAWCVYYIIMQFINFFFFFYSICFFCDSSKKKAKNNNKAKPRVHSAFVVGISHFFCFCIICLAFTHHIPVKRNGGFYLCSIGGLAAIRQSRMYQYPDRSSIERLCLGAGPAIRSVISDKQIYSYFYSF